MTKAEKVAFIVSRGWHTWYNPIYYVNPKTVSNPKAQDYTNYGMSYEEAYFYEISKCPPFSFKFTRSDLQQLMNNGIYHENKSTSSTVGKFIYS